MPRSASSDTDRGLSIGLTIDGVAVTAYAGETLATVLLVNGCLTFNMTGNDNARAPYCNMGTCFECQVRVAGGERVSHRWLRACMIPAEDGMSIKTGESRQTLGETRNED